MAINVSVQYNGGFLPDIMMLLTQCYTINRIGDVEPFSSHVLTFPPFGWTLLTLTLTLTLTEGLDAFVFFYFKTPDLID